MRHITYGCILQVLCCFFGSWGMGRVSGPRKRAEGGGSDASYVGPRLPPLGIVFQKFTKFASPHVCAEFV